MSNNKKKSHQNESSLIPKKNSKQNKLFYNLQKILQQFMEGRGFVPLTQAELMERLHLPEQHTEVITAALHDLVNQKILRVANGRYSISERSDNLLTGILRLHPRGFGFVKAEVPGMEDIFIPKHLTQNAVDGDTVEVIINTDAISEKGPEGRVVSILSRARTHLAGIIREVSRGGNYYAYAPMLGINQRIIVETDIDIPALIVGDRIVMKVIEWGNKDSATICKFSHHLGHISDPACDVPAAIEEFEIRKDFPSKAVEEARQYGQKVTQKEIRDREDIRELTCITIDPDTAKDFDDAISLSKDEQGHYHLGVHIADVSHYVHPGTALDDEACLRCNSTYFPGTCIPMLPPELCDNLCSLKPNVNRLTISVFMEFDGTGELITYRIAKTVIRSAKRFTYREAKAVLDGKKQSPHLDTLRLMVEMCGLLKRKRYERGSIEFGMPELVVIVDDKGVPTTTDYVVYDITHQLVEEFMLKANEVVAWHLTKEGKHLTYRVHDVPAEENLKDFSILATAFGFKLSPTPTPKEIQKLFDEAMQTSYGEYLATSYIRRMRLAVYSSDNIGHYGLSLEHYCHFTSPIRRYVDLVVHRILFNQCEEKETLEKISSLCSDQERISAKAENSVVMLKKLRLLDSYNKVNPKRQYEAVVTRVKNFGIYFEVLELMLESYLHVSDLDNDYFVYDEKAVQLKGKYNGFTYKAGDKLTVMLKEIDFITIDSKWHLVGGRSEAHNNYDTLESFERAEPTSKQRPKKSFERAKAAPKERFDIKGFFSKKSKKAKPTKQKSKAKGKPSKKKR